MAFTGITLEAHQAGGLLIYELGQLVEALLRPALGEVFSVDFAELGEVSRSGSIPTGLRIAQCREVNVSNAFMFNAVAELVLGEALLPRDRHGPDIGQKLYLDALQRGDEAINVSALVTNGVQRRHANQPFSKLILV